MELVSVQWTIGLDFTIVKAFKALRKTTIATVWMGLLYMLELLRGLSIIKWTSSFTINGIEPIEISF